MFTREVTIELMKNKIQSMKLITAAWEGGSKATGFLDQYSDLDMYIVTKDEDTEEVLNEIVEFIEEKFGIERKFRMPEPNPYGFSQVFAKTMKTPELFYIDFVVMGESVEDKFIETDRHGVSDLWVSQFKLSTTKRNQNVTNDLCKKIYDTTVSRDFLLILELEKQIKRNLFSEAFPNYLSFISRCLVSLMNIKYRPEKADFGMRYIYRDFPEKEFKLIEDAMRVGTIEELKATFAVLLEKYHQLVEELK